MSGYVHIANLMIVYSFLLISLISYPQNQTAKFEHLTIEDGLSQNHVTSILKDSKGFMWFCTFDGLNRYDGKDFKVYEHDPEDSNSLSHNQVQTIYEDKYGNLWIGTFGGGVNKFEMTTEKFTHFRHDPKNSNSICSDFVLSVYEDKAGFLWIGTNGNGINKFNKEDESFVHYSNDPEDPNTLSHNIVRAFHEDESEILWIGTDGGGLNKFDKKAEKFTCYKHDPNNPKSLSHDFVLSIVEDEAGALWLATGVGLVRFDRSTETFMHYKPNLNDFTSMAIQTLIKSALEPGIIWISTHGIYKFGINKKDFTYYKYEPNDPTSLSSNTTVSIYEDDTGLLWIGTADKGVNKYKKAFEKIHHYKKDPTNSNSLSDNFISAIHEDKAGILWIGTDGGGLNKYEREKDIFTHYKHQHKHQPDNSNSLSNNKVYSIIEEKLGILWISTFDGLNRFDTKNNRFTKYYHDPDNPQSLSHNLTYTLYKDREDNLWIGTIGGGLNKLILNENEKIRPVFCHYQHNPEDPHSISGNAVTAICEGDDGFLWVGTDEGLNIFDKKEEKFYSYKHDPNNPNGLSSNSIITIYQDKNGVLWIGTIGGGLNRFNLGTENFIHYQEKDGLANNSICGILEDSHQNLWLSTKNGLSKFNQTEVDHNGNALPSAFKNYYVHDGFQDNEFMVSYFKNSKGEMFFGGINGFNAFYPDSLKENLTIPALVITDFRLFNEDYKLDTSITEINQIVLSHNENFFSFNFAVLDYTVPEKNNYAYKLDGLDNDWNYVGNRNFAHYTNLNPGEYVFCVKGSNNQGVWNEEGASIKIIILPPWWATAWAYIIYAIILLSTIYFTWKLQLKRVRNKHELEITKFEAEKMHEVDEMKSRFFANISHEFRTPLTLILGPVKDILEKAKDVEIKQSAGVIKRNASRLYGLVNQLLDLSKLEAGKMKLEASVQNIIPLLKGYVLSFSSLSERRKIKLSFNAVTEKINVFIDIDKLEKIVSNLLSNAFKFTPEGGEIIVSISKSTPFILLPGGDLGVGHIKNVVEVSISDTGIGISKERLDKIFDRFYQVDGSHTRESEGTGIGLSLTKELVELHKGKIEVESEYGKGTTFTVRLPLGKDHLKPEEIIEEKAKEGKEVVTLIEERELFPESRTEKEKTDIETITESEKPLLLIVEDNADVRNYIRGYLEDYFRITEAIDGKDGLDKSLKYMPDVIVSDVMMPKMDGFELCERLKTDQKTSHIPVILLTAKATGQDVIEGLEIGADDYIMKPFDADELKARVKNMIEQRRKLRERFHRELGIEPKNITVTSMDQQFLLKAINIVEHHISNPDFSVEDLSKEIGMSRSYLNRKLKALTDKTTSDFICTLRLKRAAKLLQQKSATVSEVAFDVGFSNLSYFARKFREQLGKLPSEYSSGYSSDN